MNGLTGREIAMNDYTLAQAYHSKGQEYFENKDYQSAIEQYTMAIDLKPTFADAYFQRGLCYIEQANTYHAFANILRAIELAPDFACGNDEYTELYAAAIRIMGEAIQLDSNNIDAYYMRGMFYYAQGSHGSAIADLREVIALDSEYGEAYLGLGRACLAAGRYSRNHYESAIKNFTKAIDLNPQSADAYRGRGHAYYCEGNYARATIEFLKAERLRCTDT